MRLELENICKIHKAEIDINGITVIAGENNTGKSTVGKMLYTMEKAMANYGFDYCQRIMLESNRILDAVLNYIGKIKREEKTSRKQLNYIDIVLKVFKQMINWSKKRFNELQEFDGNWFEQEYLYRSKKIDRVLLDILIIKLNEQKKEAIESSYDNDIFIAFLNRVFESEQYDLSSLLGQEDEEILHSYIAENGAILDINRIRNLEGMDELQQIIRQCNMHFNTLTGVKLDVLIADSFSQILKSEFLSGVIEPGREEKEHLLKLKNDFDEIFKILIREEKIEVLDVQEKRAIKEVTYIESPIFLYLNYFEAKELKGIPSHIGDLINKLSNERENRIADFDTFSFNEILEGNFAYDGIHDNFVYKENNTPYKMTNVANGTKAFGILQMLNEKGWLSTDNIMIIDEPEVHLHPKWQVEYCKVISALARQGIRFVITTHSPYIVQAIKKFSGDFGITKDVNFYLSEESEEGVMIQDKTNKLGDIYEKLTAPLREIM